MVTRVKGLKISQIPELKELTGEEMIPYQYRCTNGKISTDTLKKYIDSSAGSTDLTEVNDKISQLTETTKLLTETTKNLNDNKQDKGDYALKEDLNAKQDLLVSGENIKTINGVSILGDGDIQIASGGTPVTIENLFGDSTTSASSLALVTSVKHSVDSVEESVNATTESVNNISNLLNSIADEEDLTLKGFDTTKQIKFADKDYKPAEFSGMGRVYLRKNIVGGKNVLTQEMMNKANTRYIIQYDYNLNGETINIPDGCVLDFQGGSLKNGNVIGNNTEIKVIEKYIIFYSIHISGNWKSGYIYSEWFDFKKSPEHDDSSNFKNLMALSSDSVNNDIYISSGDYYINVDTQVTAMDITSNTKVHNAGTLHIIPTSQDTYRFFRIKGKTNVTIVGGVLVGDKDTHTGSSGEWGHGIYIQGSSYVTVKDVTFMYFWGDGMEVSSTEEVKSQHIIVSNCTILECRRQGISVVGADKVNIDNCTITGISGTQPQSGIDFEPFRDNEYNTDCVVSNCTFKDNSGAGVLVYGKNKNINIVNCISNGVGLSVTAEGNVVCENCNFGSGLTLNIGEIEINKCIFGGVEILSTNYNGKLNVRIMQSTFGHDYITMSWFSHIFIFRNAVKDMSLEVQNSIISVRESHPLELNPASFSYKPKLIGCVLQYGGNLCTISAFDCYNCIFDNVYRLILDNGKDTPINFVNSFVSFKKNNNNEYQYIVIANSESSIPSKVISNSVFQVEGGFSKNALTINVKNTVNNIIFSGNTFGIDNEAEFLMRQEIMQNITVIGWSIAYYLRGHTSFRPVYPQTGDLFYDRDFGKMIMYKDGIWSNIDGSPL